jgi:nicotinamidase/pyrazinamidase
MNALILVDIQNDFVPGGALAVPGGDEIVPLVNAIQREFELVVATQDWHPPDHGSFASNHPLKDVYDMVDLHGLPQVLWPVHCVQHTPGAAFVPGLDTGRVDRVFRKGTDPTIDSYSGFFDNGRRRATGLGDYLAARQVDTVCICGIATDYCVKFTALDARHLGFNTLLVEDATRGVNVTAGDVERAVVQMRAFGVDVVRAAELFR